MHTKEVENLKMREIFRLVENTIENNLRLYLTAVAGLSLLNIGGSLSVASTNYNMILLTYLIVSVLGFVLKIATLKKINIDDTGTTLIKSRVKNGKIAMQIFMCIVFSTALIFILGIATVVIALIYSAIALLSSELGMVVLEIIVLMLIPIGFAISIWIDGIYLEIFCKGETQKFISKSYSNIFKSKTKTFNKLLFGNIMDSAVAIIIVTILTLPQSNTFGMIIMTILYSCFYVIFWTYTYVVYMTSMTETDIVNINNEQIKQDTNNKINNTSSSEEITRLW